MHSLTNVTDKCQSDCAVCHQKPTRRVTTAVRRSTASPSLPSLALRPLSPLVSAREGAFFTPLNFCQWRIFRAAANGEQVVAQSDRLLEGVQFETAGASLRKRTA